jgi:ankyrin repeat protein
MTPLMIAVHQARAKVVERLLAADADVNARTTEGGAALHRAAGQGRQELARLLLDLGADPNAATDDGYTPLHLAVRRAKMGVVRLLLSRGADVDAATRALPLSNHMQVIILLIFRSPHLSPTSKQRHSRSLAIPPKRFQLSGIEANYRHEVNMRTVKFLDQDDLFGEGKRGGG